MKTKLHNTLAAAGGALILAMPGASQSQAADGLSIRIGPGGVGVHVGKEPRHPWHRGQHYKWGPGPGFYYYKGHYYGECQWLKERALETGSRKWLRRYEQCKYG